MPELVRIQDPADPRLEDYRAIRERDLTRRGVFIAEGELVIRLIAGTRFAPRSALVTPAVEDRLADAFESWPASTPIFVAPEPVLSGVAGFHIHRGALASVERGAALDAAAIAENARTLVILEDLTNHDNIGGVFRNVAALGGGAAAVLLSPGCADPLYRKSIRVSMGHAMRVPFARMSGDMPAGLAELSRMGFELIGLTPDGSMDWPSGVGRAGRVGLVLGSEGPGLSEGARAACARRLAIPMNAGVDSLNVSAACAIALDRLGRTRS